MAVQFTKVKTTLNFRKDKPVVYQIQQVSFDPIDTRAFVQDIAETCGMPRAMVRAMFEAMTSRACHFLKLGRAVQMGELGTLKPVFRAAVTKSVDELGTDNIRSKKVRFYPGQRIKDTMRDVKVSELDLSGSTIVGDDE